MATFDQIKTPSQLKGFVNNSGSYYFERKTMKFFGDTMRNYGIRKIIIDGVLIIELYRKKPVKNGLKTSSFWQLKEGTKDQAIQVRLWKIY